MSNLQMRRAVPLGAAICGIATYLSAVVLGQEHNASPRPTLNLATPRPSDDRRPVIGAYYYPWYGVRGRPLSHDWQNLLRQKLVPPQAPLAGLYRSDDPEVIAEHLAQSRRARLDFWALSWWGPDSPTDRTIREAIFKHPDASQLRYAALYESTGRLGDFDRPRYDNFLTDIAYLSKHYFDDTKYLKINGRPVLFIYLSREYFRGRGHEALAEARRRFPNVYLVGDDVFGGDYRAEWAQSFDAVTSYDVYGQSTKLHRVSRRAVQALVDNYAQARQAANSVGTAFVPAVAPGYNDTAVRQGNPGTPRYFVDEPDSQEGDLFRAMIRRAALPHLDDRCSRLLMVTSFNEWYEDSQIEATKGHLGAASIDSSGSKRRFTDGAKYVDYGRLYLDILRQEAWEME